MKSSYSQVKPKVSRFPPFHKARCNSELKMFLEERVEKAREQELKSIEDLVESEYMVKPLGS